MFAIVGISLLLRIVHGERNLINSQQERFSLDIMQNLISTLPKDSRFDLTNDFLAAIIYLESQTQNKTVPAKTCQIPKIQKELLKIVTSDHLRLNITSEDESLPTSLDVQDNLLHYVFDTIPYNSSIRGYFNDTEDPDQVIKRRVFNMSVTPGVCHSYPKDKLNTDETVATIAFDDFGAHRIQQVRKNDNNKNIPFDAFGAEAKYAIYLNWMWSYPVRDGYARYGADAYFDKTRKLTHIVRGGVTYTKLDGAAWEFAKLAFKGTLRITVTIVDHLYFTHLGDANALITAVREELSPSHPLRRLLTPWGFGTASVNKRAVQTLIGENRLNSRASAFTETGLSNMQADQFNQRSFKRFDYRIAEQGLENAYTQDGRNFYDVVRRYVKNYFDIHFKKNKCNTDPQLVRWYNRIFNVSLTRLASCEDLVHRISTLMVAVSAGHNHYTCTSQEHVCLAPSSFREGASCGVPRDIMYLYTTQLSTGSRIFPKILNDFSYMFQDHESKKLWQVFQKDLTNLEKLIVLRNAKRSVPFYGFLPSQVEISTSY